MSTWMRLVNDIKRAATDDYLTPHQRDTWTALCDALTFPQRINLCGPAGAGKTFIAWMTARATGAVHLPLPSQLANVDPGVECLLVDNAPTREAAVRALWAECNLLEIRSVVLISRTPVEIATRTLTLGAPNLEDLQWVASHLLRLGHSPPSPMQDFPSLWHLLHHCE